MQHVMIDIEALGGHPGGVILAIGAQEFDADSDALGTQFRSNISIKSSLKAGLVITEDTVKWWLTETSQAAREALYTPPPVPLPQALKALYAWWNRDWTLWAFPITFDVSLLHCAYVAINMPVPWKWTKVRDCRSLFDLTPGYYPIPDELRESVGIEHSALDDAIEQARYVQRAFALRRQQ